MPHPLLTHPNLLARIFDGSALCVLLLDAAGRVVHCNERLAALGGWDAGTLLGRDGRSCIGAEPQAQHWLAAWLAGEAADRALGTTVSGHPVQWSASALRDASARTVGLVLIGFPSDAAAADMRTRRLADFYRALADTHQAIVALKEPQALYDAVCRIAVESGRAAMAWIGVAEGDRLVPVAWGGTAAAYTAGIDLRIAPGVQPPGPSVLALLVNAHQVCNDVQSDPRMQPWRDFAAGLGVRASGAFPFRRGGGVSGTLNLYFDQPDAFDPPLIALLDEMANDLSFALDNVDREAARVRAEQALREREQQLSEIIDTAMDAIITVDASHRVVVFNRAAERIFGLTREDAIGHGLDRFIPEPHRAGHRAQMAAFAAPGGAPRAMGRPRALTGLRADGTPFPMEASISRVGEGERVLMTVMVRDVTQLRQAEQAELARTAAEAANQAKTEFLSRISHELRTPLNAVLGFSRLLRDDRDAPLNERQQRQVELVLQAGSHLHTLIDEMLDVSRIEAGDMAVEPTDFDLGELLDGVLRMSEPHAASCGVHLVADHAGAGPLPMHSDAARLRQVLLNVVSNAIKYNRRGGWVRVGVQHRDGMVDIEVEDNGLGMSEQQLAELFQPFNRLGREHGSVPGMGIGLALVRKLVRLLDGDIHIDSREGVGTTVRVRLPAGGGCEPARAVRPAAAGPAAVETPLSGVVLYVEDNPVNVVLVQQLLSRWPGVQLVVAADGTSGLQRARTLMPDLVLLDMQLPDISGIEVLHRLRADPATAGLAVVALSASAIAQDVQAALEGGARVYWTKPIDFDLFLSGMRRLLQPAA